MGQSNPLWVWNGPSWKNGVPLQLATSFCWRMLLDNIQTKDNLKRKNIGIGSCPLCNEFDESTIHLLFTCKFSHVAWANIYRWEGVLTALLSCPSTHLWQHCARRCGKAKRWVWWVVWVAIIWSIWKHRNGVIFNNKAPDISTLMDNIKLMAWKWLIANERISPATFLSGRQTQCHAYL